MGDVADERATSARHCFADDFEDVRLVVQQCWWAPVEFEEEVGSDAFQMPVALN